MTLASIMSARSGVMVSAFQARESFGGDVVVVASGDEGERWGIRPGSCDGLGGAGGDWNGET
jgi:hypothetical protein